MRPVCAPVLVRASVRAPRMRQASGRKANIESHNAAVRKVARLRRLFDFVDREVTASICLDALPTLQRDFRGTPGPTWNLVCTSRPARGMLFDG